MSEFSKAGYDTKVKTTKNENIYYIIQFKIYNLFIELYVCVCVCVCVFVFVYLGGCV